MWGRNPASMSALVQPSSGTVVTCSSCPRASPSSAATARSEYAGPTTSTHSLAAGGDCNASAASAPRSAVATIGRGISPARTPGGTGLSCDVDPTFSWSAAVSVVPVERRASSRRCSPVIGPVPSARSAPCGAAASTTAPATEEMRSFMRRGVDREGRKKEPAHSPSASVSADDHRGGDDAALPRSRSSASDDAPALAPPRLAVSCLRAAADPTLRDDVHDEPFRPQACLQARHSPGSVKAESTMFLLFHPGLSVTRCHHLTGWEPWPRSAESTDRLARCCAALRAPSSCRNRRAVGIEMPAIARTRSTSTSSPGVSAGSVSR